MLHAALRLTDHARADVRRIDVEPRRGRAGRRGRLHRGRHPRRAAGRHHPQRLAGHDPRGRAHLLRRRRARHRRRRDRGSRRAARPTLVDVDVRGAAADHRSRSPRSTTPRSRCGAPTRNVLSRVRVPTGATPRPRWPPAPTSSTRSSTPSASSTRSSSRSRRSPSPTPTTGALHVYSGGQGVWDDRNQIASVLGVEHATHHRRAGVQRRRVRRQGGHGATRRRPRSRPGSCSAR